MADTVYVLGAGVNQCVEAWGGLRPPLAKNFFRVALQSDKFSGEHYTQKIAPVYEFIHRYYKKTKDQLQAEMFDLEEIFTLLEQQQREAQRKNDESRLIELTRTEFLIKALLAEYLSEFEHHAVSSDAMRRLGESILRQQATVITFNYDCILEAVIELASGVKAQIPRSFWKNPRELTEVSDEELGYSHYHWNRPLAYGFQFSEVQLQRAGLSTYVDGRRFYAHPENQVYANSILKLHGSLNWFRFVPVRRFPTLAERTPELPENRRRAIVLVRGHWWFAEPPELDGWLIDPVLITPVLDKDKFLSQPLFTQLWERARAELSECRRLITIGYSFPATDFHTKRLFLEAFEERPPEEVIVVNPDPSVRKTVLELAHAPQLTAECGHLEEYLERFPPPPLSRATSVRGFKAGDLVTVTIWHLEIGGLRLSGSVLAGRTIARTNDDGTYQVRGIISTPESDEVTIPADWIHEYNDSAA